MKTLALLVIYVLTTLAKRAGPGGAKAIIAESVLLKHQLLIARRSIGKSLRLTTLDRFLCGFLVLFMHPRRIRKAAVVLKPATLTKFRRALQSRNYHRLFSSRKNAKPGPKGPSDDLVRVIVELKRRNTRFGCPRIAQQINKAFGLNIDKDVVRRVLAKHYRPEHYDGGPSWVTFFRHMAVCTVRNQRLSAAVTFCIQILLIVNASYRAAVFLLLCQHRFTQDQMTSESKTGMEGVAEEKGIAPAKI